VQSDASRRRHCPRDACDGDGQTMSVTPKRGLTVLLAGLAMFGPFAIDTMFPAFPAIAAEFGADDFAMQQTLSIYLVSLAVMSLVHGPLSDALGRRPVVIGGVAVFTLAKKGLMAEASVGGQKFKFTPKK